MTNLFTTFDELSPEAVEQLQTEAEEKKIQDFRDKGLNDEKILKEMQKATAAYAKKGVAISPPIDPVEEIKGERTPLPTSQRFITGETYVSPRKGERNYFLVDDDNKGLDFNLTSYRKISSTPTDLETNIIGAPVEESKEIKSIPLFSGVVKVELPTRSGIEIEGAGKGRQTRSVYLKIQDKSRDEINNMVNTFVTGENYRNDIGAPEFPLFSDRNNPLTIERNGINLKVDGNLQTVKEFKTDPRIGLLRTVPNAVGNVIDFGGMALVGGLSYARYGISQAWNATGANLKRTILDGTVGVENWFNNDQYNKWHETISSKLEDHLDIMPDSGGFMARQILQYNVPTLQERIDGAADYTKDDLMRVLRDGTIAEDFITDVASGKLAYKTIDRFLGLVGYGPKNAVIFRKMFAGDVDINKKNILGLSNRVGVRIRELNDYAKQKYGKPWMSGFEIWKESTGGTKNEWTKLADAKKTPWINKSIGNFFQLSIEKDGGLFQKVGDFIRKGRLETGASLPVYNKMAMLSETYASAGGIALDSAGIPGGYLIGGIVFGSLGPTFSGSNILERARRNRVGNIAVAGIDSIGNVSAYSPMDAMAFFFFGKKPLSKLEYESAVGKWKTANPDKIDGEGNILLSNKELQEEIYSKYAVTDNLRAGTLPSFYITQADGTRKLIQEGDKEHKLLQSYTTDLLESLEPEDIKVIRDQIGGFLDLQNDLADLMEKFPGQYKDDPANHPFYKMGLGLFEVINVGTSRQLAYQAAERINFGLAKGVELGVYEKLYQKNLRMIEGLSTVFEDALKFADDQGISGKDFSNIQPVLNKLGEFLDETREFTEEAVLMPKILTEINGAVHGTGKYKEGLQFSDLDNEFQQYIEHIGLKAVFGSVAEAEEQFIKTQQIYGKQILDLRSKLRDNPDAWNPENRQLDFNKSIDIANSRITGDAQKIYAPLKNIIPNMAPIKGDDVDDFFINVFDTLSTDPLERFTGASLKSHHKRGLVGIFTEASLPVHDNFMKQLRKTYDSDGNLRTQYENGDINLQEYNNAVINKFKEGIPEADQYDLNNPISTYKFLVDNKENPLIGPLKETVGDITLTGETIAEFDRVFRSNSSRIKNQMKSLGSDKQALSARLNKYTSILGGSMVDSTGEITAETTEGTLKNILAVRNGEQAIKILQQAPKNYASAVAPRRWSQFAEMFEAIDRIDTPLQGTEGFFNKANSIVYKKDYRKSLLELGNLIINDPIQAANIMKRKFGSVGRIQTKLGEDGSPIYETVYVVGDNKSAELISQISRLAVDEATRAHYIKVVDEYQSKFGKDYNKFADDPKFLAELNRMDGNALLPGGRVHNSLEDYNRALTPESNIEVWNGKMTDNGEFLYTPASEHVFSRNVQGEEKPNGKLSDMVGKKVFNYYDTRFSSDSEFLNFVKNNDMQNALKTYQKKILNAKVKYEKRIKNHLESSKKLYDQLNIYVNKTLSLNPRIEGQPPTMQNVQSAAKNLMADGNIQNIKNFEEFLIQANNPKTGEPVLAGTFRERQKEARKFISSIVRQNFVDEVLDITDHLRSVRNEKTGKFEQTPVKILNYQKTQQAVEKYSDILKEYLHSDVNKSEEYFNLFTKLALMMSKMQSAGPSGGYAERAGRMLTKSVITNIPTPLTNARMFNRFLMWKRGQVSGTTIGGEMSLRAMALNRLNDSRILLTMSGSDFDTQLPGKSMLEALTETLEKGIFTPTNQAVIANKLPFLIYESNLTFDSYSLLGVPMPLGFDEEGDQDIRAQERLKLRKIEESLPKNIRESESQPLFKEEQ